MGQDKALIRIEGEPLLTRTARIAAICCDQVAIACPEIHRYRALVSGNVQWIPETHANPAQPPGPLVALVSALPQLTGDWILLLACDMPYLQPLQLLRWRSVLTTFPHNILAAVPQTDRGWEPLAAFYRPTSLPCLQAWLAEGQQHFQGWLSQLGTAVVPLPLSNPALLFNCNTPADLDQLGPQQP
jgi:molybdenum cofactor guanylyltransferase